MEAHDTVPQDTPMGVSYDDALRAVATDPVALGLTPNADQSTVDAARDRAARNLMAGAMANAVYWGSRPELEQLRALHDGHGTIGAPPDAEGDATGVAAPTDAAGAIDGTAVEEPATALGGGGSETPAEGEPASEADKLRAQLRAAGLTPEA